ncbi:YncE family protein [candidate division WWE3 bacterium]|uniref:YncE family protein n=1 Tax=candidate division WWE3 bacterium TaxID=2053526 RepID=A0A955LJR5_UNCKA|nr:YncE family protein [candidate division WWE3 bacterium]
MKLPSTRLLVVVIVALVLVIIGIVAFGVTSSNKNTGPIPTPVVEEPSLNISVQDVEAKDDLTDATYSRTRGMFYVSSVDESLLYVINPDTGKIDSTIQTPNPSRLLFSADESVLYTTDGEIVRKLSTATFDTEVEVKVSKGTYAMALTNDNKYLFVVNEYTDSVAILNPDTLVAIKYIAVERRPVDVAMSADGQYAFVANYDSGSITKIALSNLTVVGTIQELGRPVKLITYTPQDLILVLDEYGGQIIALRSDNNEVVGTIEAVHYPSDFSLDTDNNRIYVASYTDGEIGVVDIAMERVVKVVPLNSSLGKVAGLNIVIYAPGKNLLLATNTNYGEIKLVGIK